jgi:hypothetical protein
MPKHLEARFDDMLWHTTTEITLSWGQAASSREFEA